jgi:hypothetical protein
MGCPALTRRRTIVDEIPIRGMAKNLARSPPWS